MNDFKQKFQLDKLTIHNYEHWVLSVRPAQLTLGSLVLSLKRQCSHLAGLTSAEAAELAIIFQGVERSLQQLCHFDKINYLALMMVDEQVHFHILPRYQKPISFAGQSFQDAFWPGPVTDFSLGSTDSALLSVLVKQLTALFSEP